MYYVLIFPMLLLAACTVIHVSMRPGEGDGAGEPSGVSVQTSNSTTLLGSQVVEKGDQAGRGEVERGSNDGDNKSAAVPTVTVPVKLP